MTTTNPDRRAVLAALTFAIACLALMPAVLFFGGCRAVPTMTDGQGRAFVRVREMKPRGDGTFDAELWQERGKVGPGHPFYAKMMSAPIFTRHAD